MLYFHGGVVYWVCLSKINDIMNDRYSKSTTENIRDICENKDTEHQEKLDLDKS